MITKKLLLLGEIGVGKTSLVRRLVHDEMKADYIATMGVDLYTYRIEADSPDGPVTVELVIWDLDGNYGESIFQHIYSRGASAAMIIGDAMRQSTLLHMVKLADSFQNAMPSRSFAFVVNKTDLLGAPDASILPEPIREARQPLIWTSALTALNVVPAFKRISDDIVRREH